mmetsp:Transcript_5457/g.8093  ORF Transcript_5457/g.8093 Transcript_5457/m.8093 type:complete len:93 (-) Transcript_5457:37-315(-)
MAVMSAQTSVAKKAAVKLTHTYNCNCDSPVVTLNNVRKLKVCSSSNSKYESSSPTKCPTVNGNMIGKYAAATKQRKSLCKGRGIGSCIESSS